MRQVTRNCVEPKKQDNTSNTFVMVIFAAELNREIVLTLKCT